MTDAPTGPLDMLKAMAVVEVDEAPGLVHIELFTMKGLLSVLWHGPHDADRVVVALGGAMGGLLGPGKGLYPTLGQTLAAEGIGLMRVSYRKSNDLDRCTLDAGAALDLAWRRGARRFVTLGHSFGGAVAIRTAVAMPAVAGVVTYATQSAGCEPAAHLDGRPLLLIHGSNDRILPLAASLAVRELADGGELVILDGEDHLLAGAQDELLERTLRFVRLTMPTA